MFDIYRRHTLSCPHRSKGRRYTRCGCPIWACGELDGAYKRFSLKTRIWDRAVEILENPDSAGGEVTLRSACEAFINSCQGYSEGTIDRYRTLFRLLLGYFESRNLFLVRDLTVSSLTSYRSQRDISPSTSSRELRSLRVFCKFCSGMDWLDSNPAAAIRSPPVKPAEVLPYTDDEVDRIIKACGEIGKGYYERSRARAAVLLLRYTALRISDVATLKRDRVRDGEIYVRAAKNGIPIMLPIPEDLQSALEDLPTPRGSVEENPYLLWRGRGRPQWFINTLRATLQSVFRHAGIKNGKAHRFRHTMATNVLSNGGTLQDVSDILGIHPVVAEKHYVKWTPARQDRIRSIMQNVQSTYNGKT